MSQIVPINLCDCCQEDGVITFCPIGNNCNYGMCRNCIRRERLRLINLEEDFMMKCPACREIWDVTSIQQVNVSIITNKNKCKRSKQLNLILIVVILSVIIMAGRSIQDFIFCKLPNSKRVICLPYWTPLFPLLGLLGVLIVLVTLILVYYIILGSMNIINFLVKKYYSIRRITTIYPTH